LTSGASKITLNYLGKGSVGSYTYYILATAQGGSSIYKSITINIVCGPNSVTIVAPTLPSLQFIPI